MRTSLCQVIFALIISFVGKMSEIPTKVGDLREHHDRSTHHVSQQVSHVEASNLGGVDKWHSRVVHAPHVTSVTIQPFTSDLIASGRISRSPCRNNRHGNGEVAREGSWCGSERATGELVEGA
jgi:hypothetical protein